MAVLYGRRVTVHAWLRICRSRTVAFAGRHLDDACKAAGEINWEEHGWALILASIVWHIGSYPGVRQRFNQGQGKPSF